MKERKLSLDWLPCRCSQGPPGAEESRGTPKTLGPSNLSFVPRSSPYSNVRAHARARSCLTISIIRFEIRVHARASARCIPRSAEENYAPFLVISDCSLTDSEVLCSQRRSLHVLLPRGYYERVFPTAVFSKIRNSRYTNPRGYLDSLLESRQSVRVTRTVKRFFVLLSRTPLPETPRFQRCAAPT